MSDAIIVHPWPFASNGDGSMPDHWTEADMNLLANALEPRLLVLINIPDLTEETASSLINDLVNEMVAATNIPAVGVRSLIFQMIAPDVAGMAEIIQGPLI